MVGRLIAGIAVVDALNTPVDERGIEVTEHILDGLVLDFRVLSGDGALQNADTFWILIESGLDVLRLPKRILWLKVS
jgi:hypothetical protein